MRLAVLIILLSATLCHGQASDTARIANALEGIDSRGSLEESLRLRGYDRESLDSRGAVRLEQQMMAAGQNIQALQQMLRAQVMANQQLQVNFNTVNNRLRKLEGKRGMSSGVPAPPLKDVEAMSQAEYDKRHNDLFTTALKSGASQDWATAINNVYAYLPEEDRPKVYILIEKPVDK